MDDTNRTHIDIGTNKLGYRKVGQGPDLLFLHGWPLHKETYRDVVDALPDFTCHLLDFPGCGDSIGPKDQEISFPGHIEATLLAIEALELDRFSLVGQDSGGLVARHVADRLSKQVDALLLTGTEIPGHHPPMISRLAKAVRLPMATAITRKALRSPTVSKSGQLLGGLFWDRDLVNGSFRDEVLTSVLDDVERLERQLQLLRVYDPSIVDQLELVHAKITCPTLLIFGAHDPFFPVDLAKQMATQFGGPTEFITYDEGRLLVYEEYPERFAADCRKFLTDLGLGDAQRSTGANA